MKTYHNFILSAHILLFLGFLSGCNSLGNPKTEMGSSILTLESSPGADAQSIYLTYDSNRQPVAVWAETTGESEVIGVHYARWEKDGFTSVQTIPLSENPKVHHESVPKLIFKPNGDMLLFYEIKINHPTNDRVSHIKYQTSKDDGNTWSIPQTVHSDGAPDQGHSFFDVALLSDGEVGAVWLDTALIKGGRAVLFSKTDGKNRFGKETVVDSMACQCCRTALHADQSGLISVVYRDILPGSIRDISVATSQDGGDTFSSPVSFSFDQWNLDGCPHNGPDVVSDGQKIYTVWFTGAHQSGVYFAELDSVGKTLSREKLSSNGKNIQLTLVEGNPLVVYSESHTENGERGTRILSLNMASEIQTQLSLPGAKASYPTVLPVEKDGYLTAWLEYVDGRQKIKVKQ